MRKFSGTAKAGSNNDLVGATCDAFAHFSVYDSDHHLVFVDIQGTAMSISPALSLVIHIQIA
jgi:hypothetical protein